jgi:hypothetical protein
MWDDDKLYLLKKLWSENYSASHIASKFGVTRDAVLGKLRRLGLLGKRCPENAHFGPRKPQQELRRGAPERVPTRRWSKDEEVHAPVSGGDVEHGIADSRISSLLSNSDFDGW